MSKQKRAREIAERERKRKSQILTVVIAVTTLAVALAISYLLFFAGDSGDGKSWRLDSAGLLSFGARPAVAANVTPLESTPEWTLEKISYPSFGDNVYALLRTPKNASHPPVVIVLPAASVNKEADAAMAKALCSWGYATLTLDERGNNGETPGPFAMDLNSGYNAFVNGGDPVQYAQVHDVLLGYDYLKSRADLDGNNAAVLGESMGGRFAIVAAALEPGLKAAFAISSGPYGAPWDTVSQKQYVHSIEPAGYLSKLPPRKLVMFHFTGDPIISVGNAKALYDVAGEPRAWHEYNGTVHGVYSDVYAADLRDELRGVFGR